MRSLGLLVIGTASIAAALHLVSPALGDEPPSDRSPRATPPPEPVDLRTLEAPPLSLAAIRDEMMPSLERMRPDLARALGAPAEEQWVSVPLPDSLIPEPVLIPARGDTGDADTGAAMQYALFSTSPSTRLSLPYLSVIGNALEDARRGDLAEEERDLVILAADLWVRSVSASEGAAAQIADSLRDLGVRFHATDYCGTLLEPLAERPDSTPWASRAFVVLLEQGWLGACRFDFGEHAFSNDIFIAVIEHGERFLAAHPRSPIRDAVALRVALAHETAWSIDKWDSEYFFHESWDADAERRRTIDLYEELSREMPDGELRAAIGERLRLLRRDQDTGCRVYHPDSEC